MKNNFVFSVPTDKTKMSTMTVNVSDLTFSLNYIIPSKIFEKLLEGDYSNVDISDLDHVFDEYNKKERSAKINENTSKGFYYLKRKKGEEINICTINSEMYEHFNKTGEIIKDPKTPCIWCRRKKENITEKNKTTIPGSLPLHADFKDNKILVHTLLYADTFNCALAETEERLKKFPNDIKLHDTVKIIHLLFEKCYPTKILFAAPDYYLLDVNVKKNYLTCQKSTYLTFYKTQPSSISHENHCCRYQYSSSSPLIIKL